MRIIPQLLLLNNQKMGNKLYLFSVGALIVGSAFVTASKTYNYPLLNIGCVIISVAFGLFIASLCFTRGKH